MRGALLRWISAVRANRQRQRPGGLAAHEPTPKDDTIESLIAPLPETVRDAFRRCAAGGKPLRIVADLFMQLRYCMMGAGVAEGRGGYPGGTRPGWSDYVDCQRGYLAIYHALVEVYGEPAPSMLESFRDYERSFG